MPSCDCPPDTGTTAGWYPLKLEPSFRERVWGREDISLLYPSRPAQPGRIGEVWLTADDNRIANGRWAGQTLGDLCRTHGSEVMGPATPSVALPGHAIFPLLVKFVFTSDKLSVQVHPADPYAAEKEGCAGKTEMWHVLTAEPGACLALGFRAEADCQEPDVKALRAAAENGAIEDMLCWMEVRAGETFFVPAGTVHAIGAGLTVCEIQQNSDITYRLFDYNRSGTDGLPRPLHLEKALDVLQWRTAGGRTSPLGYPARPDNLTLLAACPYFATEKMALKNPATYKTDGRFEIWIGLEGEADFEVAGEHASCRKGEVVLVPAIAQTFSVHPVSQCTFLRSYQPQLESGVMADLRLEGFTERQLRGVCFPEQRLTPEGAP